jgi:hypothetical protein
MAKLVVTRPLQFFDARHQFHILIDGERAATIAPGKTVEIELAPGRHQVKARVDFLSSPPAEIEAGPAEVRHLQVGSNLARWGRLKLVLALLFVGPIAIQFITFACGRSIRDPFENSWFTLFTAPMMLLPFLLFLACLAVWREDFLYIEEIRDLGPTLGRVAFPPAQPPRVRITVRGMMIAVAILAILFGATIEWGRYTRRGSFRRRASLHAQSEALYRDLAQKELRLATELEKSSPNADASFIHGWAARAAAKADYHAAMKRKYGEAAARRAFSLEPDPPEPP